MTKQNRALAKKINLTIVSFVLLFSVFVIAAIYWSTENFAKHVLLDDISSADGALESNINFEKTALLQTLLSLKNNSEFVQKFKSRDKDGLLVAAKPFFEEIKTKHKITHFYFITPDEKCFLRVHKPEQCGDVIDRITLKKAIETNAEFVGLEMGKNFFSLRAVTPVYDAGELVGYMEIGREMDHFFANFKKQTGFDITLALNQKYVENYQKQNNTVLKPEGESVGGYIILNSSDTKLAKEILSKTQKTADENCSFEDVSISKKDYFCYQKKMLDAKGEYAGVYVIVSEHTALHENATRQYLLIAVLLSATVLALAYAVKKSIDKDILKPIEEIRAGVVNFFAYLRGDAKNISYIPPMVDNEIGVIASALNESIEETMHILEENERNEAYLLQKSRVAALGEMIANMAHHWRQPLNVISITAQDMLYAKESGDMNDEYLQRSVHTITHMTKELSATLDKLRNLYTQKSYKEEFCIEDEVEGAVSLFREYMSPMAIEVDCALEQKHIAHNYKNEFSQTLIGILQNSKEAIEKNGAEGGKISVSVSVKEGVASVSVADNGGGIEDDKVMQQIFDPYFTTKFKTSDVGLGLYLAKVSVEKNMGGKLIAKKINGGLEMTIELPLAAYVAI